MLFCPFALARCECARYVADMLGIARPTLVLPLICILGACAGSQGDYPSLAIRDVERAQGQFASGEPARLDVPPVEVDLTGGLEARLASLVAAARQAHDEFVKVTPRAEQLVAAASGSDVGNDRWAAAQVALAELDSARSRAAIPLGDLDTLYTAARISVEEVEAIDAARNEVIALVSAEDTVLADLRAAIP